MSLRRTLAYAVLVAAAVVYLYPFVIQVATSLKTDPDASTNPLSLLPHPSRPRRGARCSAAATASCPSCGG